MRKDLLSLTLALAMGGAISANAQDGQTYALGQQLTLAEVQDGTTPFVLVRASDNQVMVYGTNGNMAALRNVTEAMSPSLAAYFKMDAIAGNGTYETKLDEARNLAENAFDGDETNVNLYLLRVYKNDLTPFSMWNGNNYYMSHCGWTMNSNLLEDNIKFGGDEFYGCIWKVMPSTEGYTLQSQSLHNKNYVAGNGGPGSATDWKFYTPRTQYTQGTEIGDDGFYNFDLDEKYFETSSNVTYSNGIVTVGAGGGTLTLHLNNSDFRSVTNILNDFTNYDYLSATNIYLGSENKGLWSSSKDNLSVAEERRVNGITRIVYTLTEGTFTINSIKLQGSAKVWPTDADVTTFDLGDRVGNSWTFATPADLSNYKYMVVTTYQSSGNLNGKMTLTDASGKSVSSEDATLIYSNDEAHTRGSMYLDRWNNQNCACVNLKYIGEKGIDITQISSFTVPNGDNISAIYLTNYETGKAVSSTESWGTCTGDYKRENALLSEGKYGTIALKYAAAVSGAEVYTVDSWDGSELTLARHYGVLEAGVPYFYMACDFEGHDAVDGNKGTNSNVNFYRVDANAVTGDWSDNNARDNGLVGYYDGGFWPFENKNTDLNGCYLLSNNELHLINGGEITLGTNRCFFDPSKYQESKGSGSARIRANGSDANAIDAIQATKVLNSDKIYNLNGQEVKTMQKGQIYIMGGMKIRVK